MAPLIKTFAVRPLITSLAVKYLSKVLFSFVVFDEWLKMKKNVYSY
jgi:hypothetical protein